MRAVLTLPDLGWLIVDRIVADRPMAADTWWHLHPAWRAVVQDGTVALRHTSGRRLALATTADDIAIADAADIASVSLEYGRVEQATTLWARHRVAGSVVIGTFVPVTAALSDGLAIAEISAGSVAASGWMVGAFAIRAGDVDLRVEIAFPLDPEAQPRAEDWPQPCITRASRPQMAASSHQ
jgi:hypothetical protein